LSSSCCKTDATCTSCTTLFGGFGGWGLGSGKCRAWLSYRPCRTPMGECGADYLEPHNYTFFLDWPCHPTWKPVQCCNNQCGTCGQGSCGSPNGNAAPTTPTTPTT